MKEENSENNSPVIISEKSILIISIFIAGLCSIIYELLISTTSSYFLGDSVKQFSITIGVYMAAMGIGSWLSRLFNTQLLEKFIFLEIILGLCGGISVPLLYYTFSVTSYTEYSLVMILMIMVIGILTGLEIPLLTRLMKSYYPLKINLSNVLAMDYFGALLATLIFPFFLLPILGLFKSSLVFGGINISIAFLNLWAFSDHLGITKKSVFYGASFGVLLFFATLFYFSNSLMAKWSGELYRDPIVYHEQTPYQELILTKSAHDDLRLYINNVIQFSSIDEYRYHESLVHLPMSLAKYKYNVLVLGGGEGLVARELLKYKDIEQITVVDIDEAMFKMAKEHPQIKALNKSSLSDDRVALVTDDAYNFMKSDPTLYNVIIADLPDPSQESLARLYSREFYKLITKKLAADGLFVTQATGTYHTTRSYWCIEKSMQAGGLAFTYPYHAYVPAFGDWGFILGSKYDLTPMEIELSVETKFLENHIFDKLFYFEKDLLEKKEAVKANTLDQPFILEYFLEDWKKWQPKVK